MFLFGAEDRDERYTPGGTLHDRMWPVYFGVSGMIEGTATVIQTSNWTLPSGERCYFCGNFTGPVNFEVDRFMGAGVTAELQGHLAVRILGETAAFKGTFVLQGSGDLEGVTVRLTLQGNLPPFGFVYPYEGTALISNNGG